MEVVAGTHAYALTGMFTRGHETRSEVPRSAARHGHSYPGRADRVCTAGPL